MTTNIFSTIAENDDDFKITPREKFLKKAAKKLNEIERLKEKGKYHSLTIEECEKLLKEDFWKACLYEEPLKPNLTEERKRKKEEERRVYDEYKKKMEEEERKRKEEEQREKMRKEEDERKRKFLDKKTNKKINRDVKRLEDEYRNLLLLHNGNNDKTFRLLSLKYHPDKNVDRITWASEMQKQLGEIREKFSSCC